MQVFYCVLKTMTVLLQELGHPNGENALCKKKGSATWIPRTCHILGWSQPSCLSTAMMPVFTCTDTSKTTGTPVEAWIIGEKRVLCVACLERKYRYILLHYVAIVYSCDSRNDVHNQVKVGTLNSQNHRNYRNSVRGDDFFEAEYFVYKFCGFRRQHQSVFKQ